MVSRLLPFAAVILLLWGCNPNTVRYTFIFNDEGPNEAFARQMELLLEDEFNVDIQLIRGVNTRANLDSLAANRIDMALAENYVPPLAGVSSAFAVYQEVLHIFYRKEIQAVGFSELFSENVAYIGIEGSPSYNIMMDLFDFFDIQTEDVSITFDMTKADIIVLSTNLLSADELKGLRDYDLFSFDPVDAVGEGSTAEGIALKYPRLDPFVIPQGTYWEHSQAPIVTLSLDIVMMVRSTLGEIAVNDLVKTMLQNRQIFAPIDPLLHAGLSENFDRSKLNIPLHEGARVYLDRDEPGFFEKYAELAGVILSIAIAIVSGLASLIKWQAQKKKDRIDVFYEHLLEVKNIIPSIRQVKQAARYIKEVQVEQNKAFELLISEELVADDSFRIYMELSRETISDLRARMRALNALHQKKG